MNKHEQSVPRSYRVDKKDWQPFTYIPSAITDKNISLQTFRGPERGCQNFFDLIFFNFALKDFLIELHRNSASL